MEYYNTFVSKSSHIVFTKPVTAKKDVAFMEYVKLFSDSLNSDIQKYIPFGISQEVATEISSFQNLVLNAIVNKEVLEGTIIVNSEKRTKLRGEIYALCKHISTLKKLCCQKTDLVKYTDHLTDKQVIIYLHKDLQVIFVFK